MLDGVDINLVHFLSLLGVLQLVQWAFFVAIWIRLKTKITDIDRKVVDVSSDSAEIKVLFKDYGYLLEWLRIHRIRQGEEG